MQIGADWIRCGGKWLAAALAAFAWLFTAGLVLLQIGFSARGGFGARIDLEEESPDRLQIVRISHREPFPCVEVLNPPAIVTCDLIEKSSGAVLDTYTFRLYEESCLREPLVKWRFNSVSIAKLSYCDEISLVLERPTSRGAASN
jgi:hypothetical protein